MPFSTRLRVPRLILLAILALGLVLAAAACGGGTKPAANTPASSGDTSENQAVPEAGAGQGQQSSPTKSSKANAPSSDIQTRVSDSLNRTLAVDNVYLPSYHLEINATEPEWNPDTKKVDSKSTTVKADVAGEDIHLTETTKQADKTETAEGYIVKGGIAKEDQGGKDYQVVDGKLQSALGFSLRWVGLPLQIGIPLIVASSGAKQVGQEVIDGRKADKFDVNTANAPPGVIGAIGTMISLSEAKGTAWVDQETGSLLKLVLDYKQDLIDPPGSKTVVGKGDGHIDLSVTQVGKVKVTVPPVTGDTGLQLPTPQAGSTTASQPAEEEPTAAPTKPPQNVKAGQRAVVQGVAITVTKVDVTTGPDSYKADPGKTFVAVRVTVENTGTDPVNVDYSQFQFVGKGGDIYPDLENGTGGETAFSPDTFDSYDLEPKDKIENKIILVQIEQENVAGLKLQFYMDDDNQALIDLGL